MTENDVRNLIRENAERAGSVRALAREWGMSQAYLDKQLRGTQAIGDKTLEKLNLIRRKTYLFYEGNQKGVSSLGHDVGNTVAVHDTWREEQEFHQRETGHGKPMTPGQVARIIGVTPRDLVRLIKLDSDFPSRDAKTSSGIRGWKAETFYGWLRMKARAAKRQSKSG